MEEEMSKKRLAVNTILGIICFLLAALIIFLGIPAARLHQYQRQISLGDKYLEALDYEDAVLAFRNAIEISEKRPVAYLKLAVTYIWTEEYDKAIDILDQAEEKADVETKQDDIIRLREASEKGQEEKEMEEKQREEEEKKRKEEEEKKQQQEEIFKDYVKDILAPEQGIANIESVVRSLPDKGTKKWYQKLFPQGILSALVEDLDKDGEQELLVLTLQEGRAVEHYYETVKSYSVWVSVYELVDGTVSLSDKKPAKAYDGNLENPTTDFVGSQFDEVYYYVTVVPTEENNYICFEKSEYLKLFTVRENFPRHNLWNMVYDGMTLQYTGSLTQTIYGNASFVYTEYSFENGANTAQKVMYAQYGAEQGAYANYADAAKGFMDDMNIPAEVMEETGSVIKDRESCIEVLDYVIHVTDINIMELELKVQDYTEMRAYAEPEKETIEGPLGRETIKERVLEYYTMQNPEGRYYILDDEIEENEYTINLTVRLEISDEKASEIMANGGDASTLIRISVDKSSGEAESVFGDVWNVRTFP